MSAENPIISTAWFAEPRGKEAIGPGGKGIPPYLPDRPHLFDEVEWGPLPTAAEAQRAYKIWSMQDECLQHPAGRSYDWDEEENQPTEEQRTYRAKRCLALNVYEALSHISLFPLKEDQWNEKAQYRRTQEGELKGWHYSEIIGFHVKREESVVEEQPLSVPGHRLSDKRYWTHRRLEEQLIKRNLDTEGTVAVKLNRLIDYERQKRAASPPLPPGEDNLKLLPREDLSGWGIKRENEYMLKIVRDEELTPLDMYTWAIILSPYNPAYWTSRAFLYYQMGHFDLALGDAYRAQLLCEALTNYRDRNCRPGLYIRVYDAIQQHILQTPHEPRGKLAREIKLLRERTGIYYFLPTVLYSLWHITSLSLLGLHCWADYESMEPDAEIRNEMPDRVAKLFEERWNGLRDFAFAAKDKKLTNPNEYYYESRCGTIMPRTYPYSATDVDRGDEKFLERINKDILGGSLAVSENPQKIKVEMGDDGELSVVATDDISSGETVYVDEPSVRGHLRAHKLGEARRYCENCKRDVPPLPERERHKLTKEWEMGSGPGISVIECACSKTRLTPMFWCMPPEGRGIDVDLRFDSEIYGSDAGPSTGTTSGLGRKRDEAEDHYPLRGGGRPAKRVKREPTSSEDSRSSPQDKEPEKVRTCLEIARELFHYKACGRDWTWLHDAMRYDTWKDMNGSNGPEIFSFTHEGHGTVLALLLREVFDITLHRRDNDKRPNLLAHEIDELMPLKQGGEDDFHPFPFTFAANIQVPFDILQCLGVNIFRDLSFDTWVIQIVLRKLLLNVVPWDHHRRGKQGDKVDHQSTKFERDERSRGVVFAHTEEATFRDLYLFTGMAMFNHACPPKANVTWDWDVKVPNRVILWANRKIYKGEELFLSYSAGQMTSDTARRILGGVCFCEICQQKSASPSLQESDKTNSMYGRSSSATEPPEEQERRDEGEVADDEGEEDEEPFAPDDVNATPLGQRPPVQTRMQTPGPPEIREPSSEEDSDSQSGSGSGSGSQSQSKSESQSQSQSQSQFQNQTPANQSYLAVPNFDQTGLSNDSLFNGDVTGFIFPPQSSPLGRNQEAEADDDEGEGEGEGEGPGPGSPTLEVIRTLTDMAQEASMLFHMGEAEMARQHAAQPTQEEQQEQQEQQQQQQVEDAREEQNAIDAAVASAIADAAGSESNGDGAGPSTNPMVWANGGMRFSGGLSSFMEHSSSDPSQGEENGDN